MNWDDRDAIDSAIRQALVRCAGQVRRDRWHKYHLGGKKLSGVTSVIGLLDKSRALMSWAARLQQEADVVTAHGMAQEGSWQGVKLEDFQREFLARADKEKAHQKASQEARDLGHAVHSLVEHECRKRLGLPTLEPEVSEEALWAFAGWEEWANRVQLRPVAIEAPVYSAEDGFAGTLDLLGWVQLGGWERPRLTVIDWKTANGFYAEMDLQSAAYRLALRRMGILAEAIDGLLVRLPKDTAQPVEEKLIPKERDQELEAVFLHLLAVYPWHDAMDKAGLEEWKRRKRAQEEAAKGAA